MLIQQNPNQSIKFLLMKAINRTRGIEIFRFIAFFAICIWGPVAETEAQRDGIRGYGMFEFTQLNSVVPKDYVTGGGGVRINNNILAGVYVSALTEPHRWDLFLDDNGSKPRLSVNDYAINTTISNTDVGVFLGFNVMPDKPFQFTLGMKAGYSIISFSETVYDPALDINDPNLELDSFTTLDVLNSAASIAPQLDIQLKIGRAFKISGIIGFRVQDTIINGEVYDLKFDDLLIDSKMFGGVYLGLGIVVGNL